VSLEQWLQRQELAGSKSTVDHILKLAPRCCFTLASGISCG
jgi:hypothetical protein